MANGAPRRLLVLCLFFLSGFSGLLYEILWVRMLSLLVGGSSFSVSIVFTTFMAGLALGGFIGAKYADRLRNLCSLVVLYGILELAIGFYGLLFPYLITSVKPLYACVYGRLFQFLAAYNAATFVLSSLLLIIPATLMGATLPLLSRFYITGLGKLGTSAGRLYAVNTVGAALGSLLCGFWLIRWLGVRGTLFTAVGINIFVGVASLFFFRFRASWVGLVNDLFRKMPRTESLAPLPYKGILFLFAVSGFCAMAYEVIWTRLLILLVGPTTYALTIILFTFIVGLALGSLFFGWLADKTGRPLGLLVVTQIVAAFCGLFISQVLGSSQIFFAKLLFDHQDNFTLLQAVEAACLFLFMLPLTLCLGAAFPLVGKLLTDSLDRIGRTIGIAYTINTVGAAMGAFSGGFLLIPFLGKESSITFLAIAQVMAAGVVCMAYVRKPRFLRIFGFGAILVVLVSACYFPRWNRAQLARGKYHDFSLINNTLVNSTLLDTFLHGDRDVGDTDADWGLLYYGDGIGGFTTVARTYNGMGRMSLLLSNSGKPDASTYTDMSTQMLSAHLPLLFHPDPKKAMVIGLASGITAGEMLHYPIQQLDVLEISPQVVEACGYFSQWNNNVLQNPRARIIVQDARTHIELSDEKYDVISSEPSNPWMAGLANLYTLDFFQKIKQSLNSGGIFAQWIHLYKTDWETLSMLGRTLHQCFPHTVLFETRLNGNDLLFLCFKDKTSIDFKVAEKNLAWAQRSKNMSMSTSGVLAPLIISDNLGPVFGAGPIHTDVRPILEYLAPMHVYRRDVGSVKSRLRKRGRENMLTRWRGMDRPGLRLALAEYLASVNTSPFGVVSHLSLTTIQQKHHAKIISEYCRSNTVYYHEIRDRVELAICCKVQEEHFKSYLQTLLQRGASEDRLARVYAQMGELHRASGRYDDAIESYRQVLRYAPDDSNTLLRIAAVRARMGRYSDAIIVLKELLIKTPDSVPLLSRLGVYYMKLGKNDLAEDYCRKALKIKGSHASTLYCLGHIYSIKGDYQRAVEYVARSIALNPGVVQRYETIVLSLIRMNRASEASFYVKQGLTIDSQNKILLRYEKALEDGEERFLQGETGQSR